MKFFPCHYRIVVLTVRPQPIHFLGAQNPFLGCLKYLSRVVNLFPFPNVCVDGKNLSFLESLYNFRLSPPPSNDVTLCGGNGTVYVSVTTGTLSSIPF